MNDLISVIIPVKNGSKYIIEAIDNIKKQDMNVEIIVNDDCSSDNTVELAKNKDCIVIKNETCKGPVAGKNNALKIVHGKYILFHDHDDIMREGSLKKLYDELVSDESISAVEAKVQDWYSPDLSEEEKSKTPIKQEPYWGLFTGAILMKKDVFDKIGFFNEAVHTGEIIEWQSKMDSFGLKIKKLDFVSTDRRIHSSNFGKTNKNTEFKNYAAILRAKIAAQRQNNKN